MELILIHKGGEPTKLENYRGIALLNVPMPKVVAAQEGLVVRRHK